MCFNNLLIINIQYALINAPLTQFYYLLYNKRSFYLSNFIGYDYFFSKISRIKNCKFYAIFLSINESICHAYLFWAVSSTEYKGIKKYKKCVNIYRHKIVHILIAILVLEFVE